MIVVFGSVNADFTFEVEALPRPGETVLCPGYTIGPGGKGANQAAAAAKAGARVQFVGHLGDDAQADAVRQALGDAGVDLTHLATAAGRPTAMAVIGVDRAGENAIIVASGANLATEPAQLDAVELGPDSWVLCQNELRSEATFEALLRAAARGARTALNMAPAGPVPDEVLRALDLLVVNELEAAVLQGGGDAPIALGRDLAKRFDLACVVTLGGAGALAATPAGGYTIGALPVTAVDTTGAGDAFVGGLVAALDAGHALPEALRRASVGAALACTRVGAQSAQPRLAEIEARLDELAPAITLEAPDV